MIVVRPRSRRGQRPCDETPTPSAVHLRKFLSGLFPFLFVFGQWGRRGGTRGDGKKKTKTNKQVCVLEKNDFHLHFVSPTDEPDDEEGRDDERRARSGRRRRRHGAQVAAEEWRLRARRRRSEQRRQQSRHQNGRCPCHGRSVYRFNERQFSFLRRQFVGNWIRGW